jgi:hypothetical protein
MTEERTTPLRERMIEDMRDPRDGRECTAGTHPGNQGFAAFLGRSPDVATPKDLRAYQLHMADAGARAQVPLRSATSRTAISTATGC